MGAVLAAGYALLLWPEPEPRVPQDAIRTPFAWRQDACWIALEQEFAAARTTNCEVLASRIDRAAETIENLLSEIAANPHPPESELFTKLESNLFQLAPFVAACPQRLGEFLPLVTRSRAVVKRQSESWDINLPAHRTRLYRLIYGGRMALEEAMLQAPPDAKLPEVVRGDDEPSRTPSANILGVTVHSGDILLSRGGAPTSALIARGNDFPGNFSHVALLHVDEQSGRVWVVESHIERGVAVAAFDEYLRDKKLRVLVLRLRADLPALVADPLLPHQASRRALDEARRHHIPYDFAMNWHEHDAQFCSEVAAAAYEAFGVRLWMGLSHISSPTVRAWLASLGVRHFETQEPADLEYDPQLRVVAEWRDRAALFKAHVDDAVTDAMLAEAEPGVPLHYSLAQLPLARVVKAYSVALNMLGKVGPIPEGMSAATALRVGDYRRAHAAIASRVLLLAEKSKNQRGYPPPFWELVRLPRQARHEVAPKS